MGCSGAAACGTPAAGAHAVDMARDRFSPATLHVRVGDTVTWTDRDPYAHTVTSDEPSGPLDSGNVASGDSWRFTFTSPGSYRYHCVPHSWVDDSGSYRGMVAEIVVE